jgi:hypothetical protein
MARLTAIKALAFAFVVLALPAKADPATCDMTAYRTQPGLSAAVQGDGLVVTWNGDGDQQVRLGLAIDHGAPLVREIALRRGDGEWTTLAANVEPEYSVMTGLRRMSKQQLEPLYGMGVKITQAVLDKYRWDPFWDAPFDLSTPPVGTRFAAAPPPAAGLPGTDQPGLPRKPDAIQRAVASYALKSCTVRTDGARLEINFPGVHLGLFDGALQFTVYRDTNLIRQEIIASTKEPWVAYKYDAGLKGLPILAQSRVHWRDTANNWQTYALGGQANEDKVPLAAANRVVLAEQGNAGSIAAFPPPHKFFWARELAINMGYNWYRKDSDASYSIGIRQNEREDPSEEQGNWALYSARPGTRQLMPVYLYPSLSPAAEAVNAVLAFTHGDHYKPLPGYQVMQHHYHMDLGERLAEAGNLNLKLPDLQAIKALGINIVSQVDSLTLGGFSLTSAPLPLAPARPGPSQLRVIAAAVEGARLSSDSDFLVMADEEVFGSPLGGHTDLLFKHPVYWDQRQPGQAFEESSAKYGKVYHVNGVDDFMKMVEAEDVMVSMPHPRTKGSTGFPDVIKDRDFFNDRHYQGFGLRWGMGLDGSETRTCEYRCLPLLDDLSNWVVDRPEPLKYAISISEVSHQQPGDDIYASAPITYVHLDKLPPATDPSPVIAALMRGDMFITTGEVLVPHFEVRGAGSQRTVVADVEWTFPLDKIEIVWGNGKITGHQEISTTDLPPFGLHHFVIPFDARGKKWLRFAAWDSASEGAILEPLRLDPQPTK